MLSRLIPSASTWISIPSSINKNVKVDIPIIGDCAHVLEDMVRLWRQTAPQVDKVALKDWWNKIEGWRGTQLPRISSIGPNHQAAICRSAPL